MNTHYALIHFSGDPDNEHSANDLLGKSPSLVLIAAGSEDFCWKSLIMYTKNHPLRMWETGEVVARTCLGER